MGHADAPQYLKFRFIISIVDFICIEKKIVIEIDGESHQDQREYDSWRTSILEELGFQVVRFSNDEICGNPNIINQKLRELLRAEEIATVGPLKNPT